VGAIYDPPVVAGNDANYARRTVYGPFHRRFSDTQNPEAGL